MRAGAHRFRRVLVHRAPTFVAPRLCWMEWDDGLQQRNVLRRRWLGGGNDDRNMGSFRPACAVLCPDRLEPGGRAGKGTAEFRETTKMKQSRGDDEVVSLTVVYGIFNIGNTSG